MVEGEVSVTREAPAAEMQAAGARCIGWRLIRGVLVAVVLGWAVVGGAAQAPEKPVASSSAQGSGTSIIGCLSGPDADDHYTLTSMQHRTGVDVVGSDDLKNGAGSKVKLTGSWEAIPGATAPKSDATQRFKVTQVTVLGEKCQAPQAVTPVSKKKQKTQSK
jgi:hypothetical protein